MPPMIRCMVSRKGASSMATTNPIVTCRCIFFAGGTCFAPSSAGPTSTPARARLKRWRGSLRRSASVGPTYGFCCGADSGFTRDELMTWCEQNDVDYLFGLAKNNRLIAEIAAELAEAAEENRMSGKPARRFKDFQYRTRKSWSRQRRVVGKAEWMIPSVAESESATKPRRKKKSIRVGDIDLAMLEGRANPRFVVTSLQAGQYQARALYEKLYCARGEMENRIKECQLDLFADRTSTRTMRANQLRLWLSSMAYVLISALRRIALATTRFADATCGTIRLKLFKIGAQIRISVRRIKFSMASAFPYTDVFRTAWAALDSAAF